MRTGCARVVGSGMASHQIVMITTLTTAIVLTMVAVGGGILINKIVALDNRYEYGIIGPLGADR